MKVNHYCEAHLVQRCAHNKDLVAFCHSEPGRISKQYGYTDRRFKRDNPSTPFIVVKPEDYTGAW